MTARAFGSDRSIAITSGHMTSPIVEPIMARWSTFESIKLNTLTATMTEGSLIYDMWTQLDPSLLKCSNGVRYTEFGSQIYSDHVSDFGKTSAAPS